MNEFEQQRRRLRRVIAVVLTLGALVTLGAASLLVLNAIDRNPWQAVGAAIVPVLVAGGALFGASRLWRTPKGT